MLESLRIEKLIEEREAYEAEFLEMEVFFDEAGYELPASEYEAGYQEYIREQKKVIADYDFLISRAEADYLNHLSEQKFDDWDDDFYVEEFPLNRPRGRYGMDYMPNDNYFDLEGYDYP